MEYGSRRDGQVVGGRWKPLHYWYRASLYVDVTAACGESGRCYVRNDRPHRFSGLVQVRKVHLLADRNSSESQISIQTLAQLQVTLPAGPLTTKWFTLDGFDNLHRDETVL